VHLGKKYLFLEEILQEKTPHFHFNETFDTSVFDVQFDFFLAGSIWTHCSKNSIISMLDHFLRDSTDTGIFLTSYLPAKSEEEDYKLDQWIGTSHLSQVPGCIKHSRDWLESACKKRGLVIQDLPQRAFDAQYWLRITKS
jgi:hypothetical protein